LESVEGGETIARYTYIGTDPVMTLRYWMDAGREAAHSGDGRIEILAQGRRKEMRGDFLTVCRECFANYQHAAVDGLPPFTAGAVGYVGYDMVAMREPVPLPKREKGSARHMPDAVLMFHSTVLVFDHVKHQIWIVCNVPVPEEGPAALRRAYRNGEREVRRVEKALDSPLAPERRGRQRGVQKRRALSSNVSKSAFLKSVGRAKEHIRAGDIFQVVLSQRLETKLSSDPFEVYRALRQVNPAPYLFYLQLGDQTVLGSSPEMLVKVSGGEIEYRPIAGTRPRGGNAQEDHRLERELLSDDKERAEHVMLVDLGRNDVGRVSEYGTVRVENLMFVERYSHVMHLVSSIRGRIRKGVDAWEALWACFPAGTVSGAPKVRAMQIISELEPTRRGLYAGAVLYFDLTGNLNSCIAIRSIVVRDGMAYVQVGAGIVADSVPEREYEETMNKGKAMLRAIELAQSK
jgi:anthranilate synthase component 1